MRTDDQTSAFTGHNMGFFARPTSSAERWIQPMCLTLFAITLLYIMIGLLEGSTADATITNRVSSTNAPIWMALSALSMPVLRYRWRQVLALLQSNWILVLLYIYFTLSTTWALDPASSLRRVLFTLVQLQICATLICGIRQSAKLHVVIAIVCSITAFANLMYWGLAPGTAMTDEGLAGLTTQKNVLGHQMMYALMATSTCIFIVNGRLSKIALIGSSLVITLLLLATRSSTSFSVIIVAIGIVPTFLAISSLSRTMVAAITAGLILLILTVVFGYVAYCGVTGLDPWLPIRGATFTNRLEIWEFVAGEINKRPWFGSGYASLWAIDPAVQPSLKTDQWFGLYVIIDEGHQGFLDLWATTGIIGLGGALILLFNTIVLAGRAIRWTNIAPASWRYNSLSLPTTAFHLAFLVGLILHNFTESNFFCNNGILAFAFVTVMLDLHKWQIAVRKAGHEVVQPHDMLLLPRRVKIRPSRFS